jgi:hypothetical protein
MNHLKLFLLIAAVALLAANCEKITPDSGTPDYTTQKQPRRPGIHPPIIIGDSTVPDNDVIERWELVEYYALSPCLANPDRRVWLWYWHNRYRLILNWTTNTYIVYPCMGNTFDTIANPVRRGHFSYTFFDNEPTTPLENCVYSRFIFDGPIIGDYQALTFMALYRGDYSSYPTFRSVPEEHNFNPGNGYPYNQFMMLCPGETMDWSYSTLGQSILIKVDN